MPVYNARKHVREAIESILGQTYTEFEFLIIDDGSTDATPEIVCSYTDPRIRFIRNEENRGVSAVLNQGIGLASSGLIARMDADDISYPERLEKQVAFFREHPEIALLSTWARVVAADKTPLRTEKWKSQYYYYNLNFACWIYHPTVMYRRSAVTASGKYSTRYAEDHNLWWQMARNYKIHNLPEVLLDYRLADESLSRVTRKAEYEAAQHAQVLRNIRYYTGEGFRLSHHEVRCLMLDCEPVLKEGIMAIARCFRKLDHITGYILAMENVNRDEAAIREAAYFKKEWMLSFFAGRLSGPELIFLLISLGCWKKAALLLSAKFSQPGSVAAHRNGKIREAAETPPETAKAIPRIPHNPPEILPVPAGEARPRWSVMIPVFNCIGYLEETLQSVLLQDPGPDIMQIEVIDDHSTDGDVAALVTRLGQGRVGYHRQPYNRGSLRNFETCLNRAKGEWIHLLHGDDLVKPGFYGEIGNLFARYPQAGAAFTNHIFINEAGGELSYYRSLAGSAGLLPDWLARIASRQYVQPPAMVVKRRVYEHLGSFFAVHFGEDWEMWVRIAAHYPVAYSPRHLAKYRYHRNNITSRSFLSGQSIRDIHTVIRIVRQYLPRDQQRHLQKAARRNYAAYFANTSHRIFTEFRNPKAAFTQAWRAWIMSPNALTSASMLKLAGRYIYSMLRKLPQTDERRPYSTNPTHH
ncbi:glycosyltransferase involved in cell wall biosynthesis [Anseongella ginsenosidimutans]|uniref:Glycosyltransferase involved in cell wall biosynthesis n=2 Tax=Anseongella ginsenosidimutans TaxID=496056 RepID=A0A4R3KWH0_9SPHI|nr:glycosyltransferase [Anseongella ginsenosidimutans]TCS90119.1 glycosyltransferase involved in cell wall biosynthesis [Anseongella ginsenosidimutans]